MPPTLSTSSTGINRKELKKPDEFISGVQSFFDSLASHSRAVIVVLAIILVAGVGAAFVMNARDAKSGSARDALFMARQSLDKDLTALAEADMPKATAVAAKDAAGKEVKPPKANAAMMDHKKIDVDAKLGESVKKFKAVAAEFQGTRAAYEANLALGDLYFDHGQPANSVSWYQAAADQAPGTFEKSLSLYSLGYAFESSGKYAEAIQAYDKSLNLGEAGLKGDLLLAMARTHEAAHEPAKARTAYDQLISQMPNTDYARSAELYKGMLE